MNVVPSFTTVEAEVPIVKIWLPITIIFESVDGGTGIVNISLPMTVVFNTNDIDNRTGTVNVWVLMTMISDIGDVTSEDEESKTVDATDSGCSVKMMP